MIHFLTIGTVLGLSAGFAPGPLLTLVISETLQHDIKSGVKVALAPIITDLPIIILTLFILSKLSNFHNILGIISLAGGLFILSMGYKSMRTKGVEINLQEMRPKSFNKRGVGKCSKPASLSVLVQCRRSNHDQSNVTKYKCPVGFYNQFLYFSGGVENCFGYINR